MAGEYIVFNNLTQPAVNDTNLNLLQRYIKQDIQAAVSGDTLPVGAILPFSSDTIPDNWLLCNGQEVSRTDYYQLFDVIGTTYGAGDGFETFNLPNLQGKIPVGLDSNDEDFDTLAETGGSKELQSHSHTGRTGRGKTDFMRVVTYYGANVASNHIVSNGPGSYTDVTGGSSEWNGANHYHDFTTDNTGEGDSGNLQPYIVTNYIIKAQQSAGVIATVVDNLISSSSTNALSANQGKTLNEKIKNLTTYSTEERNTGETWIDGKTIYRKTFTYTPTTTDQTGFSHNIANVDKIWITEDSFLDVNGIFLPVNYHRGIDYIYTHVSKTEILMKVSPNGWINFPMYITVKYTKTTD